MWGAQSLLRFEEEIATVLIEDQFEGKGHCAVLSSKSMTFEATEVKEIIKIEE